jgi:hypothetical protein
VARIAPRLREAAQLGFARAGIPESQAEDAAATGVELVPLATVRDAIERLLGEKTAAPARRDPASDASQRARRAEAVRS